MSQKKKLSPDWWSKSLAGAVLGFTLAMACGGIFAWAGPGGLTAPGKAQFVMWLITPIWMVIFSLIYICQSGKRAWLYLGCANVLAYAVLLVLRAGAV